MSSTHIFNAQLNWQVNQKFYSKNSRKIGKNHQVNIEGKEILNISAVKAFKGDPELLNPEDLLLTALTSCHMMSYLYVCSQHQIEVLSYIDNSEGILEVEDSGKGQFTKIELNPIVTIKDPEYLELAKELHLKAHKLCFIANSCNFVIHHNPTILIG
jgi:organic hydroperoxide reductase OsmC/OhrA